MLDACLWKLKWWIIKHCKINMYSYTYIARETEKTRTEKKSREEKKKKIFTFHSNFRGSGEVWYNATKWPIIKLSIWRMRRVRRVRLHEKSTRQILSVVYARFTSNFPINIKINFCWKVKHFWLLLANFFSLSYFLHIFFSFISYTRYFFVFIFFL